ncbi:MAG: hypothetical protein ABI348_02210 [Nitrososphaera sp.]
MHVAITKKPESVRYTFTWCCTKMAGAKEKNMVGVTPDGSVELYDKKGELVDPDMTRCPFCKTAIVISHG